MKPILMPSHLDDQLMVLIWSADELLPGFAVFIAGVLIGEKLICFALALVVIRLYRKVKEGQSDGFLLHLLYWAGLVGGKARTLPNPFTREYLP